MRTSQRIHTVAFFLLGMMLFALPAWAQEASEQAAGSETAQQLAPIILLVVGITSVLGLIIGLKLNAFLALIISALVVSLLIGVTQNQELGGRMSAVVAAFGKTAGDIGIVIAMAALIGKCMLDSGAADRIVKSAVAVTGEKKASVGLMFSGFILAVPVFFDTVFYLLVPLARSLYKRTGKHYLAYLMAIATGGAITHTLVPPTPGPLLVSAILGVDIGRMMLVGAMVALPAALAGLMFSVVVDRWMPTPMRPLGSGEGSHEVPPVHKLPSLWVSLLPVVLPVVLIGAGTLAGTVADSEDRAKLTVQDVIDYPALTRALNNSDAQSPAGRVIGSSKLSAGEVALLKREVMTDERKVQVIGALNKVLLDGSFYDEPSFLGVAISPLAKTKLSQNQVRMKPVDRRRMNRALLEDAFPELIKKHQWDSQKRRIATSLSLWGNANFALLLAAICAMITLKFSRGMTLRRLSADVEESLMSGGVIILITAAGGAFGAMLSDTNISVTIENFFADQQGSGISILLLGWGIAAVLKIAQGSSTVAMIVAAGMMSAIIGDAKPEFNMVYVATAVGAGSLCGSWMNDSGFWIFTKMGGLTEAESLKSWTPLLVVLSIVSLLVTIVLSQTLPMRVQL